uniref:tetratricopeptide repeat protein 39C-like n=1 Tax=Styela clava TaxID=7725 RepID=UPI00193A5D9D|nr:tetratricopeptide repeat protein 39C-like [Styela clava]
MDASAHNSMENGACAMPDNFDDHLIALEGIKLMLNNGFKEAEALFNKFKTTSPQMSAGASFFSFLNGMMTFEDERLVQASNDLRATQKLCNIPDETLNAIKSKFSKKAAQRPQLPLSKVLQNKIIIADCHLYLALISFIQQDITGYIKGGWTLRKAWKIYEKTYEQISLLKRVSQAEPQGSTRETKSSNDLKLKEQAKSISKEILERLYGSVSFGFGLFNLCVSLIPQKLLKVVNLIGFHGDREVGLEALQSASESEDMKAPLAMLALLWYHTVVRPFFAVDGDKADSGIPVAEAIMAKHEPVYPKSSFVLFFKGRIQRCKCDISTALISFQLAYDAGVDQREFQLMCAYEIGWCSLMELDWAKALEYFIMLKNESKWSVCYYTYLTALMSGMTDDKVECMKLFIEVPKTMKIKSNQLEIYIVRKALLFIKTPATYEFLLIYILELLYLWRAFPNCTKESLNKILDECAKITSPSLNGLKNLIVGGLHNSLGNTDAAIECFRTAMKVSDRDYDDGHIAPYACYELASILIEKPGMKQKGLEILRHCKDGYEGYDFENRLQMRIHATEHRLKQQKSTGN